MIFFSGESFSFSSLSLFTSLSQTKLSSTHEGTGIPVSWHLDQRSLADRGNRPRGRARRRRRSRRIPRHAKPGRRQRRGVCESPRRHHVYVGLVLGAGPRGGEVEGAAAGGIVWGPGLGLARLLFRFFLIEKVGRFEAREEREKKRDTKNKTIQNLTKKTNKNLTTV